jgi:cell division FtsZ-interacting protein ZapD
MNRQALLDINEKLSVMVKTLASMTEAANEEDLLFTLKQIQQAAGDQEKPYIPDKLLKDLEKYLANTSSSFRVKSFDVATVAFCVTYLCNQCSNIMNSHPDHVAGTQVPGRLWSALIKVRRMIPIGAVVQDQPDGWELQAMEQALKLRQAIYHYSSKVNGENTTFIMVNKMAHTIRHCIVKYDELANNAERHGVDSQTSWNKKDQELADLFSITGKFVDEHKDTAVSSPLWV